MNNKEFQNEISKPKRINDYDDDIMDDIEFHKQRFNANRITDYDDFKNTDAKKERENEIHIKEWGTESFIKNELTNERQRLERDKRKKAGVFEKERGKKGTGVTFSPTLYEKYEYGGKFTKKIRKIKNKKLRKTNKMRKMKHKKSKKRHSKSYRKK
jgi:hypothetical protein